MAFVVKDRVQETTATTGTGTLTLAGAVAGFQAFSAIGDGNTTYYTIYDTNTSAWEVGIGTYTASGTTLSRTTVLASSNAGALVDLAAGTKYVWCDYTAAKAVIQDPNGFVGINTTNDGTAVLQIGAGTSSAASLEFLDSTLMTTPDGGSMEFDGNGLYFTNDTTSSRGQVPAEQIFRLTANGSAIGPAISNFFGANSAVSLLANSVYELEARCLFTKTTAGTVVVTLTTSQTPQLISGTVWYGAATGGTATGASNQIAIFASTTGVFGASLSLSTAANHAFTVKALIQTHATLASDLRINFTESAGTVTPFANSYYKIRKLPPGNVGSFVA